MLADGGIPVGCQTVLLRGVNDNAETIKKLMLGLLKIRVKPYYLFQADLTKGVDHFRTPTHKGVDIMRKLYGHISGLAIPTFAIDAPGGKGKIPLTPSYIKESSEKELVFESYSGEICSYPESGDCS
jgi:lysine 2,3-aminomutase